MCLTRIGSASPVAAVAWLFPAGGGDHETSAAGDELMRKAAKKMDKWSVEQRR